MGSNQGITQLVNKTFAKYFSQEIKANPLTFIAGSFYGERGEDAASGSSKDVLAGAVIGKTLSEDDGDNIATVTRRVDWKKGAIFTPYNPENPENKNHYALVINNNIYEVWLCLENGDGFETGLISTIKPAGAYGKVLKFDDGYKWLKLYSINGKMTQFLSANFMPVPTFDNITNAPDNTPLREAEKSVDYWWNNIGKIMRVEIDSSIKDIRWTSEPKISLRQITDSPAKIFWDWQYTGYDPDASKIGWKLANATVTDGGSGYTQTVNNLELSSEPNYSPMNIDSDELVGNDYATRIKKYGPLIKLVLFAGHLDFVSVLNADRVMLLFSIDSSEIAQHTSVTQFDSVTLVQNLKDKNGEGSIEGTVGKNKAFRMTDIITTAASHGQSIGNEMQSATVSGGTRGIGARVAASRTSNSVEVTRHDGNIAAGDTVWSPSVTSNSTMISSKAAGGASTAAQVYLGKSVATTTTTVSSVNKGEGKLTKDSLVLYSNRLSASSPITAAQGIRFRCVVGGTDFTTI